MENSTTQTSHPGAGRYLVKTLGCKANLFDSQLIEAELQKRGWKPLEESRSRSGAAPSDAPVLCIVNSCTVTDEADVQSRKLAARLSRENPRASVVITGCGAEVDPERLKGAPGIHYVIGNRNKPEMIRLILDRIESADRPEPGQGEILGVARTYEEIASRHPIDREWPDVSETFSAPPVTLRGNTSKTRAFLKVQEGCNAFCTYCIIPYGRGPSRSVDAELLIAQIRKLDSEGVLEVILTGTNIGDYGYDFEENASLRKGSGEGPLTELLKRIFSETGIRRLRLSSLDPTEITPGILKLMESEPRFCPHFHVSLQSLSSHILKQMKRRYNREAAQRALGEIHALMPAKGAVAGPFVGMDLITGFPGETDEDFEEGLRALEALPWSRLHVFPYSERAGTPATRLPNPVYPHLRVERARRLMELSLKRMRERIEAVFEDCVKNGRALDDVLLERGIFRDREGNRYRAGYTADYTRVLLPAEQTEEAGNSLVRVIPERVWIDTAQGDAALIGRLA